MKKLIIFLCLIPVLSYGQSKKKQILRLNEIIDSLKYEFSLKILEVDSLKKDSESFSKDVKELLLINSNFKFEIEKKDDSIVSLNEEIVNQEIYFRHKIEDLLNKIDSLEESIFYDEEGVSYAIVRLKSVEYTLLESHDEWASGRYKINFIEYNCSPFCDYRRELTLYKYGDVGEGIYNFWDENLEIWNNKTNAPHLFLISYKDSEFIEIILY